MTYRHPIEATLFLLAVTACGGAEEGLDARNGQHEQALGPSCETSRAGVSEDAWICGDDLVVECEGSYGADVPTIHVVETDFAQGANLCLSGDTLEVSDTGPFGVGEHVIEVSRVDAAGASTTLCTSKLTVEDTEPPEIVQTQALKLWPPNHKWHKVRPEDCVVARDSCDPDVEAVFLWASSDEPENGRGDGNHAPDIRNLDCDAVELRAERSGNQNGRVYKLGVRVYDDEGNSSDAVCVVSVVHDQRGVDAVDDGEDHRIELPEGECGGGEPNPPMGPLPPGGL